jgi:Xaa-Pro aminopeptidase
MPSLEHFQKRRSQFLDRIQQPVLLMAGGEVARNYAHNPFVYRADSNFLFFFADPEPGSAALFDPEARTVSLFLPERTAADALWHGASPSFEAMQAAQGVDVVLAVGGLESSVKEILAGRKPQSFAVADQRQTTRVRAITGEDLDFADSSRVGNPDLIQAIGSMRAIKTEEEVEEMRRTAAVTAEAHCSAMAHTRVGMGESELNGIVMGVFSKHACVAAYNNILSVRGEVLHNHSHGNTLMAGDVVLLDAGAENSSGYCSDVTRSWPADGSFGGEAGEIYDIVLAAEQAAIDLVRPGVRYRDLHLTSARVIAEGLLGMGILRGTLDGLLESGAQALFFPHGVGHLIGIDVHDMEAFGDAISYPGGRTRSSQFGLGHLRLDMDLAAGMTFTVEPGIYFVPALLKDQVKRAKFEQQVDWSRVDQFLSMNAGRGFGGIRIEDDVLCTESGSELLTAEIPRARAAVEALVGSA